MVGPDEVGLGHIASQGEDVIHVVSLHLRLARKMCTCRSSDRPYQAPKLFLHAALAPTSTRNQSLQTKR